MRPAALGEPWKEPGMSTTETELVHRLAARLEAELIETHISWVLLTRDFAYKIKKAVRLPFVDYSTLERRRHFCEEEVRLNQRLAGGMYLGVSKVTGTPARPAMDGDGDTLDYAVRMRRFDAGSLFSEKLEAGTLGEADVDEFAALLGRFHEAAPAARSDGSGASEHRERMLGALEGASQVLGSHDTESLRAWIVTQCETLEPLWTQRRREGRVRECHGDLHLANVVRAEGGIAAFDCIEFDAALRWIDVLEDAAFPFMDFAARGRADLGWRFLNGWLEQTGDYPGLPALRLDVVGRALVRALVEQLRAPGSTAAAAYGRTALAWRTGPRAHLTITHGLPGSGKSFVSLQWAQRGAVRIRSDVERKRLFNLQPLDSSRDKGVDLYTTAVTKATYERLLALARTTLQAGLPVVLDAAFLRKDERDQARALARHLRVPFSILACEAPVPVLRERIQARHGDASEADLAVLERLRNAIEPLSPDERALIAG
jgi:aminoglycoside phosphotransferase family enzyme/predicted kinase